MKGNGSVEEIPSDKKNKKKQNKERLVYESQFTIDNTRIHLPVNEEAMKESPYHLNSPYLLDQEVRLRNQCVWTLTQRFSQCSWYGVRVSIGVMSGGCLGADVC